MIRRIRLGVLCVVLTAAALALLAPSALAVGYVYQTSFGEPGTGLGQFGFAEGVAPDGHGAVYVTDYTSDRVSRFTTGGVFLDSIGTGGPALGQFDGPSAALVDSAGKLLIGEYLNGRVQVLTLGLTPLTSWGTLGSATSQFRGINQIAEDSQGDIYVTEYTNDRVQKFSPSHAYVTSWTVNGASGIAIDESDNVFVASWNNGVVYRFDTSGTPAGPDLGSPGSLPGQLASPSNMAVAPDGSLLVGETGNGRVSRFNPANGNFLGFVATSGSGPDQLSNPWGVAVDENGDLFVADRVLNVVRKYVWDDTAPVITHDYDGDWHSQPFTVTFSATDDVADVPWLRWSTNGGGSWTNDGTIPVNVDAATHSWDGVQSHLLGAGDSISNWAYKGLRIKVDTRAPVSTVSGVPAGWTNQEVYARIAATDMGSGVDRSYYDLDGGGLTEVPATGIVPVTTAGQHTLQYWSEDNCADTPNQEGPKSVDVLIDQMGPTAFPRYTVSVKHGGSAAFKYGLVDDFSTSCTVKLVIRKKTKIVKTVALGVKNSAFQVPEHFYQKSLRIGLPAGIYNWTVVATDLAGNVGSYAPKKLTVKP